MEEVGILKVGKLSIRNQLEIPCEEDVCPEHGEKVYFFCEDDEMQLCVVCREAWEHRAHTVRFLEDAAGPYRVRRGNCELSGGGSRMGLD